MLLRRTRTPRSTFLLVPLALLLGCAPYGKGIRPVLDRLARGDPAGALEKLERSPNEGDALYQLERGLLLRLVGRLEESCRAFEIADQIAEELYTRSLGREAASLATTDRLRPYRPPVHELLLERTYQVLNYVERRDIEGALVEARRVALILDGERDSEDHQVDRVAPLAHLVAGLVHEAAGDADAALVHYRRLLADARLAGTVLGRPPPDWLIEKAWRLARVVGVDLTGELPEPPGPAHQDAVRFTAVLFFEQGFVPPRLEARIDVPILKSESGKEAAWLGPAVGARTVEIWGGGWVAPQGVEIAYWLALALPRYGPDPFEPARPRVTVAGLGGEVVAFGDIAGQAREQLGREMPGIAARTAIRAITKYALHHEAEEKGGEVAGILTNVLGVATEQAETRTWLTLPHEVSVAVLELPYPIESVDVSRVEGERGETLDLVPFPGTGVGFVSFRSWR